MKQEDMQPIYELQNKLMKSMPQEGSMDREILDLLDMIVDKWQGE